MPAQSRVASMMTELCLPWEADIVPFRNTYIFLFTGEHIIVDLLRKMCNVRHGWAQSRFQYGRLMN